MADTPTPAILADAERDEQIREAHRLIQELQKRVLELELQRERDESYQREQMEYQ